MSIIAYALASHAKSCVSRVGSGAIEAGFVGAAQYWPGKLPFALWVSQRAFLHRIGTPSPPSELPNPRTLSRCNMEDSLKSATAAQIKNNAYTNCARDTPVSNGNQMPRTASAERGLFVPERDHRVDPHRWPRRQVGCEQRNREEQGGYGDYREGVNRIQSVEHASQQV
jgi:hypothetical protein